MRTTMVHPLTRLLLLRPDVVQARLDRVVAAGLIDRAPNLWQLTLGALRMWHRVAFRSDTIGTCRDQPVRANLRARLLQFRPLRGPFLLAERAIAPWDMTGLLISRERLVRHLLGAHHDGVQFAYDFEMLLAEPEWLPVVRAEAAAVVDGTHPRGGFLRDLVAYEGYHEALLAFCDRALAGGPLLGGPAADDPDLSFLGYLRWCARQPSTPEATWAAWRAGRWHPQHGNPLPDVEAA